MLSRKCNTRIGGVVTLSPTESGAGATASGVLAALWASRILRSAKTREKAGKEEETRKELTERIQLLTKATDNICASLNQEDILKTAVQETRQALAADRVVVYSLDEQSRGQIIAESVDSRYPQAKGAIIDDPCFNVYYLEKYQKGRVQATDDIYQANLTPCHLAQLEPFAVKANLVVPILHQGKLIGLLIAHHCAAPHGWQESEIDIIVQIAKQVGLVLDNANLLTTSDRLQQQKATETKRIKLLTNATEQIRGSFSEAAIFQTAVEKTRQALAADRVVVYSLDEQSRGKIIAESVDSRYPQAKGAIIDDPCFNVYYLEKYQKGRVQATDDIYQANLTPCHLAQLEPFAVKANLVVPILTQGKIIGLVIAHHCSAPHGWQKSEIDVVVQIAQQIGLAIDNSSLLTEVALFSEAFREQLPAVADLAQVALSNAQQAQIQVQQTSQTIKAECEVANQTVDELVELQENMTQAMNKIEYLGKLPPKISQLVTLVDLLATHINLQGMNLLIKERQTGDAPQSSLAEPLVPTLESLREDLAEATAEIQSLVSTIETEVKDLKSTMKAKTEKIAKGTDLVEETRQKLNQVDTVTTKMNVLLGNIINATAQGVQTSTSTSQAILATTNLMEQNSEQSQILADSLNKLLAVYQQVEARKVTPENNPQNSQDNGEITPLKD